jgi:hypothetical protein
MLGVSRRFSLTTVDPAIKASLNPLSGVVVEVTHDDALQKVCATQPGGRAGATALSKFSAKTSLQGVPVGVAVGVAMGVAVGVGEPVPPAQLPWTLNTM